METLFKEIFCKQKGTDLFVSKHKISYRDEAGCIQEFKEIEEKEFQKIIKEVKNIFPIKFKYLSEEFQKELLINKKKRRLRFMITKTSKMGYNLLFRLILS